MKKLQPDKLEPKSEKCVFIGYPKETVGYTFYHRSEGKISVAKNGTVMMMIMKLQIKLLQNLVGLLEYGPHQSGTVILF